MSSYRADLARIGHDLTVVNPPFVHVYRLYQRASLKGDLNELKQVAPMIDDLIPEASWPGDLYLLKANLAFKIHRLDDVKRCFEAMPAAFDSPEGRAMKADLHFQQGRYRDAKTELENALKEDRTWDKLARLAHLTGKLESADAADDLYLEAQDELTAKEMRSYAWIEVQRGLLDLQRGRYAEARRHYDCASKAYAGYWFIDEHIGELLGAEGKFTEAAALFEPIASAVARPDIDQAIGELYALAGDSARAAKWQQRALAAYLDFAEQGDVHYYHHLVDFYSDVTAQGAEAVKWARRDLALRENFSTQSALAWALYRDGNLDEALSWSNKALASGVINAKIFHQSAMIRGAAGLAAESEACRERALALNPHVDSFHVHH